jgi:hypothetical protein
MFSQFNDRLSSLEDIVTSLHANILEIKEENTKLKSQIASLLPKPLKDEPTVESFMFKPAFENPAEDEPAIASKPAAVAPECFMFKPAFENPAEDEPAIASKPAAVAPECFMFKPAFENTAEDEPAIASKPPTEVFMSVLKRVPDKTPYSGDERRDFFTENAISTKYYYMPIGDVPQHPNRNTLVPLGTFLGFLNYRGLVPIEGNLYHSGLDYYMRFSNYPYNATDRVMGVIHMSTGPLLYTDEPPAAESPPLHYYDYIQLTCPFAFDENGRPNPLYAEMFPTAFGDGVTGWGVQMVNYHETEQLRNSRLGAANFIAKKTYV